MCVCVYIYIHIYKPYEIVLFMLAISSPYNLWRVLASVHYLFIPSSVFYPLIRIRIRAIRIRIRVLSQPTRNLHNSIRNSNNSIETCLIAYGTRITASRLA